MALIIAGERSGAGKTTITLALLSFLAHKGDRVQSFKIGPDYIDPMFHAAITGRPCRNLDPILTSESYVQACFSRSCQDADRALVEGVMGLFDGVSFPKQVVFEPQRNGELDCLELENQGRAYRRKFPSALANQQQLKSYASTAHLAKLLNLPVLLVIDSSKISGSVAAIAWGYQNLDPQVDIVGVVLNKAGSDRHVQLLAEALKPLNLPILGIFRRDRAISIPDRHLGLIPGEEIPQLPEIWQKIAHLAQISFDWPKLLPLLQVNPRELGNNPIVPEGAPPGDEPRKPIKIAIARDKSFNFYYQDNLDLLQGMGAELFPWSPLNDESLPPDIQGIYLGGGFPEIFARQLSESKRAILSLRQAALAGIPTYAECGGLMYLCEAIADFNGQQWPMAGILPGVALMAKKLTLGYREVIALKDNLFSAKNSLLWGHEFHHSQISAPPLQPLLKIRDFSSQTISSYQGWRIKNIYASYIHLHFAGCEPQIRKFFQQEA